MEDEKRERVLEEATKTFEKYGFKKTSIEDVAKAAGIAKGTVYLVCTSKEDLFFQVLNREVRLWMTQVSMAIDPRKPADQLLGLMSAKSFEQMSTRPLVREVLLGKSSIDLPVWNDALEQLRALTTANILEVLKLGVRQGLFREDLDMEEVARILRDLPIATYLFYRDDDKLQRERRRSVGVDLVVHGLKKRE